MSQDHIIKDSIKDGWVERMPEGWRPFLRLSRYDRPIGFWLLGLPGLIGLAFAGISQGYIWADVKWAVLIGIGAVAMRGAGCTYNDIVDRDLDAKVERTALRPLPAGTVSVKQAWVWLVVQCLVGLSVLAFFPRLSQVVAVSSLVLVAAYPFMKRITYWPQAWLGLTFNWAVLVAYAAKTGTLDGPVLLLYAGLVFWTIGYDTIYACQDVEDDALIGVKSTARLFGDKVPLGVALCYLICFGLILLATGLEPKFMKFTNNCGYLDYGFVELPKYKYLLKHLVFLIALLPFGIHFLWQVKSVSKQENPMFLNIFKSNRMAGLLLIFCLILVYFLTKTDVVFGGNACMH